MFCKFEKFSKINLYRLIKIATYCVFLRILQDKGSYNNQVDGFQLRINFPKSPFKRVPIPYNLRNPNTCTYYQNGSHSMHLICDNRHTLQIIYGLSSANCTLFIFVSNKVDPSISCNSLANCKVFVLYFSND